MTDAEVIAAIRKTHLKANIDTHERNAHTAAGQHATVRWDEAWVDPGFGGDSGPYLKVPISLRFDPPFTVAGVLFDEDEIVVRVYPPERLRKKLAKQWRAVPRGVPEQ